MGKDDLFRRSFEAGTAFLDMTRERAEALVKELVKAGEINKSKAQKLVDEVLERSRKGTEELRDLIRREMTEQVSALGLATKEDVARLEARLEAMTPPPSASASAGSGVPGPGSAPTSTKAAPVRKSSPRKGASAGAPAPPMAPDSAAATKARSPRKGGPRPASGGSGSTTPAGGPPANGPTPG